MNVNFATFNKFSLGEMVQILRQSIYEGNLGPWVEIFPEIESGRSISGNFSYLAKYCKYRKKKKFDRIEKMMNQGKIWLEYSFFEKILKLQTYFNLLYSENDENLTEITNILKGFNKDLKELRRRIHVSRWGIENVKDDFEKILEKIDSFISSSHLKLKIPTKSPLEINELISFFDRLIKTLNNKPGAGRPINPFSAFVFYLINLFTERLYIWEKINNPKITYPVKYVSPGIVKPPPGDLKEWKRVLIRKNEKVRTKKNWMLIIAAIFYFHLFYDIPELRKFINDHRNEEAGTALKKLVCKLKKEYSHFPKAGKGLKKFSEPLPDESWFLGLKVPHFDEKMGLVKTWYI